MEFPFPRVSRKPCDSCDVLPNYTKNMKKSSYNPSKEEKNRAIAIAIMENIELMTKELNHNIKNIKILAKEMLK